MTTPIQPPPAPLPDPVKKSVERDSAFSKPGAVKAASGKGGKSWKPAKGVRFRSAAVTKGKPRKPLDKRYVEYY